MSRSSTVRSSVREVLGGGDAQAIERSATAEKAAATPPPRARRELAASTIASTGSSRTSPIDEISRRSPWKRTILLSIRSIVLGPGRSSPPVERGASGQEQLLDPPPQRVLEAADGVLVDQLDELGDAGEAGGGEDQVVGGAEGAEARGEGDEREAA